MEEELNKVNILDWVSLLDKKSYLNEKNQGNYS